MEKWYFLVLRPWKFCETVSFRSTGRQIESLSSFEYRLMLFSAFAYLGWFCQLTKVFERIFPPLGTSLCATEISKTDKRIVRVEFFKCFLCSAKWYDGHSSWMERRGIEGALFSRFSRVEIGQKLVPGTYLATFRIHGTILYFISCNSCFHLLPVLILMYT